MARAPSWVGQPPRTTPDRGAIAHALSAEQAEGLALDYFPFFEGRGGGRGALYRHHCFTWFEGEEREVAKKKQDEAIA